MKHMKIVFACLVALALQNGAWAEKVYETNDTDGDTEFTDNPQDENAKVIDLQQTNVVDAPQKQSQAQGSKPQRGAPQQAPAQEDTPVVVHDDGDDDGYNDLEEGESRRQQALEADPQDPHEVLNADAPHEVGDSQNQMPHEVGDSQNQMPHEVGDFEAPRDDAHQR